MKNILIICLLALLASSCGNGKPANEQKQFPKPGTVMATAKIPVVGDTLNNFMFSIKVVADSQVTQGTYDVDADFGPNFAEGQFTMPKGGEDFIPAVRKGDRPNTFIVGFKMPKDTTFYDYYEVAGSKGQTEMRYIKAYSFN